jgi:hypothetical protein
VVMIVVLDYHVVMVGFNFERAKQERGCSILSNLHMLKEVKTCKNLVLVIILKSSHSMWC